MKLVIKLASCSLTGRFGETFSRSVADLIGEGHRVVIVDGRSSPQHFLSSNGFDARRNAAPPDFDSAGFDSARTHGPNAYSSDENCISRRTVITLSEAGLAAFFLWPTDNMTARIRGRNTRAIWPLIEFEVTAVDPFWMETISAKGGVPVIVNIFLGQEGKYHWLDSDQLAAKCAIGWQADMVIFLTKSNSFRNPDGSVMRLMEAGRISTLAKDRTLNHSMLSKFLACSDALNQGVRRTIILPLNGLEGFSSSRGSTQLKTGIEVIRSEVQPMKCAVNYGAL